MLYNGEPMVIPACEDQGKHLKGDTSFCSLKAFLKYGKQMSMSEKEFRARCIADGVHIEPDWD
jgi:hypothetical protein